MPPLSGGRPNYALAMRNASVTTLLLAALCAGASAPVRAQCSVNLANVPAFASNTRFSTDLYQGTVKHPSLSLNGFACSGASCNEGYSLKQI